VLKFLSVKSIVIAPAKTGRDSRSKITVIKTAQTNRLRLNQSMPGVLIFAMVTIKFIAPIIELAPARCSEKIAKSTEGPECAMAAESGG